MRARPRWCIPSLVTASLVVTVAVVLSSDGVAPGPSNGGQAAPAAEPVHPDAPAMQQGALDALRALLADDAVAARIALDGMERNCRRLTPEDDQVFGPDIAGADRGLHVVLDRAREYAGAGELDKSFDQFVWVSRSCRLCHGYARERGLLPATPKRPS